MTVIIIQQIHDGTKIVLRWDCGSLGRDCAHLAKATVQIPDSFYNEVVGSHQQGGGESSMRVRIEIVDEDRDDEIVIYCRSVTPTVAALAKGLRHAGSGESHENSASVGPDLAFFKQNDRFYPRISEILFFETDGNRVVAHTAKDSFETNKCLRDLNALLPKTFVRISKSAIANTSHIFSIQRGLTRMGRISFRDSHKEIYVSRMYLNILQEEMEEKLL